MRTRRNKRSKLETARAPWGARHNPIEDSVMDKVQITFIERAPANWCIHTIEPDDDHIGYLNYLGNSKWRCALSPANGDEIKLDIDAKDFDEACAAVRDFLNHGPQGTTATFGRDDPTIAVQRLANMRPNMKNYFNHVLEGLFGLAKVTDTVGELMSASANFLGETAAKEVRVDKDSTVRDVLIKIFDNAFEEQRAGNNLGSLGELLKRFSQGGKSAPKVDSKSVAASIAEDLKQALAGNGGALQGITVMTGDELREFMKDGGFEQAMTDAAPDKNKKH